MKDANVRRGFADFSLRQLFLLVTFLAVSCAAFKFANDVWAGVLTAAAAIAFMAALVFACIDREARQAFAIGFLIFGAFYYGMLWLAEVRTDSLRFNPEYTTSGVYPTTRLFRVIHGAVVTAVWVDSTTGEEIQDYDPSQITPPVSPSPYGSAGGVVEGVAYGANVPLGYTGRNSNVSAVVRPQADDLAVVGHRLVTLMLAYAGGLMGRFVYVRRTECRQRGETMA